MDDSDKSAEEQTLDSSVSHWLSGCRTSQRPRSRECDKEHESAGEQTLNSSVSPWPSGCRTSQRPRSQERDKEQIFDNYDRDNDDDESAEEQTLDNHDCDNDDGKDPFPHCVHIYRPLSLCRPVPADKHSGG